MSKLLQSLHNKYVFQRRIQVLSNEVASVLGDTKTVLDIGCGDGTISKLSAEKKGNVHFSGIDVMARPTCAIDFKLFDGYTIPHPDNSFEACMFIDVLHHLNHIKEIIAEAKRVASKYIIIKDHLYKSQFDYSTLKFMDWVGNKPHSVDVIYNFKKEEYWKQLFEELGLEIVIFNKQIPLYPIPFNSLFGRELHFVALLKVKK
jgi:ubiquinone/menaquinone biosynthesis C-methylase UbiE